MWDNLIFTHTSGVLTCYEECKKILVMLSEQTREQENKLGDSLGRGFPARKALKMILNTSQEWDHREHLQDHPETLSCVHILVCVDTNWNEGGAGSHGEGIKVGVDEDPRNSRYEGLLLHTILTSSSHSSTPFISSSHSLLTPLLQPLPKHRIFGQHSPFPCQSTSHGSHGTWDQLSPHLPGENLWGSDIKTLGTS